MATLLQPLWEVRAEQACGVKPAAPLWPPGSGEQNAKLNIPEDLFWTPAESPGSPTHGHTSFRSRPAAPGGWRDPVSAAPPPQGTQTLLHRVAGETLCLPLPRHRAHRPCCTGWLERPCVHGLRLPPLQGTQTRDPGSPSCRSHLLGDAAGTDPRPLHELGYDGVLSGPCRVCEAVQKRAQHRSGTEGVRAEKHLCGVAQGFTSS
ncbi:PREDICTED: uncharacterized protein LOC105599022 [Cercocebus atys]|uniref:uncharacterized protein LOC105599022 n=1 Tax=Cercocebus atys TaxID=9531 RepID=UPI0005F3950A|nr:PREDICTED: uncharacterized protein LOC105599022 [Cercocebus atys]